MTSDLTFKQTLIIREMPIWNKLAPWYYVYQQCLLSEVLIVTKQKVYMCVAQISIR